MPVVPIKYVVSFTSQDDKHPVQHLMSNDVCKKWLCNPQDRTGAMEAIVQLENLCLISYVNVGSIWCATLEVKVGRSDWPAGREFETLIYAVSLMSPGDCTMGKNPIKTEMYTTDSFCAEIAKQEWDRIKVICRQPYRKTNQFGLSFLHVKSATPTMPTNIATTSRIESSVLPGSNASVSSIKQHFLGKINNGAKKSDKELKSKLLKIAASSEGGAEIPTDGALSRTAKLVLAAAKGPLKAASPRTKTPDSLQRGLYSNHLDQKYGPQFEDEVKVFLSKLTVNPSDLDNITLADIRHRFERKLKRKLTKEEKKKFAELTTEALSTLFDDEGITSDKRNKHLKDENTTPGNGLKNVKKDGDISRSGIDVSSTSTPNNKTSKMAIQIETRKVTPVGKRKLDSCDDIVTPPSKKQYSEESFSIKQKMKSVEKKSGALKVKNRGNEILNGKQLNIENTINSVPKVKPNKMNELDMPGELLCGKKDRYKDLKPMDKNANTKKDRSFSGGIKKTPLKESSFGEFLLNITMSDCDDDDDDILFPEQKIPKRGRGRGRGRGKRKQSSEDDLVSHSANPQTPVGRGQGSQQKGRGRGRGRQTKKRESTSVNSLETKPIGFAKCDGCEDYFGAQFLSIHQGKCISWKSKQSSSDTSTSPWLCASPGSSTKNNTTDTEQKSPPWVMAALAAERRMNQRKEGTQCSNNTGTDVPFSVNSSGSISSDERSTHGVEEGQRKHSEMFSRQREQSMPSFSSENRNISRHSQVHDQSVSGNVSNNQSKDQKYFDLTMGGSDSMDSFTDNNVVGLDSMMGGSESDSRDSFTDINNFVACPLCGDLLPKSVIEMHASNCGL